MAQDTSIEAARARIQRLVDEISAISKKEMRSEEYFQQFLTRAVQATDAKGGAVWLVAQRGPEAKAEFQLVSQVEFESALFHTDEVQHAILLRALSDTVREKKPVVSPPEPPAPAPGSLEAQMLQMQGAPAVPQGSNKTVYPFFHIPLLVKDQALGVLQVWLQPYVKQAAYQEFVIFLTSLAGHLEQHLQSRRLGTLVMENQRLQQVLRFTQDLAGVLDPLEISRLSVNYGRDLVGCERCSLLTYHGLKWRVLAISGQEVVEKKSSMVKAMAAFVGAHAVPEAFARHETDTRTGAPVVRHESLLLSKKALLARAEAAVGVEAEPGAANGSAHADGNHALATRRTDEIDLAYFEHSHVVSAAIAPLFDREKQLVGAYFAESTAEGFFEPAPNSKEASSGHRLTEWIALHTAKALEAAHDYHSLPFLAVTSRMRNARAALTGHHRRRTMSRLAIMGGLILAASFYPKVDQIDGTCSVIPTHRGLVASEVQGRVAKVYVREGQHVKKGERIAQMDISRLETELGGRVEEERRYKAEAERYQSIGDEGNAQISRTYAAIMAKSVEKYEADIAAMTLTSPIDGVVVTKDLELQTDEVIQAGAPFAEIADLEEWNLNIEINERKIGVLGAALREHSPRTVNYILYSHSASKLSAELTSIQQVSAEAYPREKEEIFIVTIPSIPVSDELKRTLRPGLTGRANIIFGREPVIWWAAKHFVDWLRLKILH
jgi:Biotin-lipoyl like/HlyD family secretion protein